MVSRRRFLTASTATLGVSAVGMPSVHGAVSSRGSYPATAGHDPWIEVDAAALRQNAKAIARLSGGRPILAVVKNNTYGLGLSTAAPLLDAAAEIAGFAVVKSDQAIALRDAGVRKPILLMGYFSEAEGPELMERRIQFAPYTDGIDQRLVRLATQFERPVEVHLYIDTGMSRLGMPYHRALPWMETLARRREIDVRGTFMTFVEEDGFDAVQLTRFRALAREARAQGMALGRLHAASSHGVFFRPQAHLDMVRPGLCLYGAYPSGAADAARVDLRPAVRLRARVVRVERLDRGDSVSYGRSFVAQKPTWIATLPVGHADGYPRTAVAGCEVMVGERMHTVIGAVSASHTIVELGDEPSAEVGDVATLLGPDHPVLHPNTIAERAGISVYDVLMHLSAALPRWVV